MAEAAIEPAKPADAGAAFAIDVDFASRTIRPSGELDIATAGLLLEAARAFGDDPEDLTIDCGELSLIGSAGLNALVSISTRQHEFSRDLFLTNVSALVKRRLVTGGCASLL
jgi:anti-anti-sigma factor